MKPISFDAFLLLYKVTGAKKFSYYTAVIVVALLHVVVFGGFSELAQDALPTGIIAKLFKFPLYIVTYVVLIIVGLRVFPFKAVKKVDHLQLGWMRLLLYILLGALIWAYNTYSVLLN